MIQSKDKNQSSFINRTVSSILLNRSTNTKLNIKKDRNISRSFGSTYTSILENQPKVILKRQAYCDFCLLPDKGSSDVLDCLLSCSDCKANGQLDVEVYAIILNSHIYSQHINVDYLSKYKYTDIQNEHYTHSSSILYAIFTRTSKSCQVNKLAMHRL